MRAEEQKIASRFQSLRGFLDEHSLRLWAAAEANALGQGGIALVHRATHIARGTISQGQRDLRQSSPCPPAKKRIRQKGGGRKKSVDQDTTLKEDLERLIDPATRGDPQSPLRWTSKSVRQLAGELSDQGHQVSHRLVAELLHQMDYSLQANRKSNEGKQQKDRTAQFEHLNARVGHPLA